MPSRPSKTPKNERKPGTMHDFVIAAAIVAFALFCLICALAPMIIVRGEDGYEDLDND
jgi:hypothetical protein